jgi:hypothetical protein
MSPESPKHVSAPEIETSINPVEVLERSLTEIAKSAERPHASSRLTRSGIDMTQDDGKSFHAYDTWIGPIEHDTWATPWAELDDPEEVDEPQKFRLVAKKTDGANYVALQGQLNNNEILSHVIISQIIDPDTGQETVAVTGVDSKVHQIWDDAKGNYFEHFRGYEDSKVEINSPEAESLYYKIEAITDLLAAR